MQDFFNPIKLEERRQAIRLSIGELCRRAGMNPSTWEKLRSGHEPRLSTARNIITTIEEDETALLNYLIALHPDVAAARLGEMDAAKKERAA